MYRNECVRVLHMAWSPWLWYRIISEASFQVRWKITYCSKGETCLFVKCKFFWVHTLRLKHESYELIQNNINVFSYSSGIPHQNWWYPPQEWGQIYSKGIQIRYVIHCREILKGWIFFSSDANLIGLIYYLTVSSLNLNVNISILLIGHRIFVIVVVSRSCPNIKRVP